MKYIVERTFSDITQECQGWSYQNFDDMLKELVYEMRDKVGHPFLGEDYRNLKFVMNLPLYHEFLIRCKMSLHDEYMYRGIPINPDPNLRICASQSPYGTVMLVYEKPNPYYRQYCIDDMKVTNEVYLSSVWKGNYKFWNADTNPHIDHVKFNGPATIVFWKDGTKTVVKHDGKGRKDKRLAVLYAFIRKIYGEGKPYHNILNEIEEAIK